MKAVILSACLLAGPAVAKLSGATINAVFQDTSSLTGFDETYARAYDLSVVANETLILAQMTNTLGQGWLGLGFGGNMPGADIYVAWRYGDEWQMLYGVPEGYAQPASMTDSGDFWELRQDLSTATSVVMTRLMNPGTVQIRQATVQPFLVAAGKAAIEAPAADEPDIGYHSTALLLRPDLSVAYPVPAEEDTPPMEEEPSASASGSAQPSSIPSSTSPELPAETGIPKPPADVPVDLVTCLEEANLRTVYENDPAYVDDRHAFNTRLEYLPMVIVHPANTTEVQAAVKCATAAKVQVAPRSSYHSFVSYGLGGKDGVLVIDLQAMADVQVAVGSGETTVATIQPGASVGSVIQRLHAKGWGYPHALGSYVGFGGSSTGGTLGTQSRYQGLTMDLIEEMEVVLASGKVVTVNESENADLFFALRGASASYGVITQFKLRVHKAIEDVTAYSYVLPAQDAAGLAATYKAIQTYGMKADPKLALRWSFPGSPSSTTRISGDWYGAPAEFEAVISPLLKGLPVAPSTSTADVVGWLKSEENHTGPLNTTAPDTSSREFYIKAMLVPETAPLTDAELEAFWTHWSNNSTSFPGITLTGFIDLWGGEGSQANALASDATALAWRDTLFILRTDAVSSSATFPPDAIEFLGTFQGQITKRREIGQYGGYPNYRDSAKSAQEWPAFYYGKNICKLTEIKALHDPNEVFSSNPQSIPLSCEGLDAPIVTAPVEPQEPSGSPSSAISGGSSAMEEPTSVPISASASYSASASEVVIPSASGSITQSSSPRPTGTRPTRPSDTRRPTTKPSTSKPASSAPPASSTSAAPIYKDYNACMSAMNECKTLANRKRPVDFSECEIIQSQCYKMRMRHRRWSH